MRFFSFRKPRRFHHINIYTNPPTNEDSMHSEFSYLKGKFASHKLKKHKQSNKLGIFPRIILIILLIITALIILKLPITL